METPTLASLDALETRLGLPTGTLEAEDKQRALDALEDASTLVLAEVTGARAAAWAADPPRVIRLVVLKSARREFENPRGINQETFGGHTVGLSESSGAYLTRREIAQVLRAATGRPAGFVGSIRTPSAYERRAHS